MAFSLSGSVAVQRIEGKGRCAFARRPIRKGELVEYVSMLVPPAEEGNDSLGGTSLANGCFHGQEWPVALALAYGSLQRPVAAYEGVHGPAGHRARGGNHGQ